MLAEISFKKTGVNQYLQCHFHIIKMYVIINGYTVVSQPKLD